MHRPLLAPSSVSSLPHRASCSPRCDAGGAARAAATGRYSVGGGTDKAISIRNLTISLGAQKRQILKGVSMDIARGSLHMILGPNGCGKSTLLRILGGLLQSDSGTCRVDGPVGFVFQNPDHQVIMPSVAADVAFGLARLGLEEEEVRQRVAAALKAVNLPDLAERPTHTLSGGQKQRVAIAGALAERPGVLLLDELTTFLDEGEQMNVLRTVRSVVDGSNKTVTAVLVTHRFEELAFADSASYMDGGMVAFTGKPSEVRTYLRRIGAMK